MSSGKYIAKPKKSESEKSEPKKSDSIKEEPKKSGKEDKTTAFEETVSKSLESSFKSTIKSYITRFSEALVEEISSKENMTKEDVISLWNTIVNEMVIKPGERKTKETDPSAPHCKHIKTRGEHKNEECGDKVSKSSKTGDYCSKHYKQNEKDENDSDEMCPYEIQRGDRKGEECGKKPTKNSKFCSKHKESGEKEDKKSKKSKSTKKTGKKKVESKPGSISAKNIKSGPLKGKKYFEIDGTKFVFNDEKVVLGTTEDEESLVKLTSEEKKIIKKPFQVEDDDNEDEDMEEETEDSQEKDEEETESDNE